jgi:hypothetical protein
MSGSFPLHRGKLRVALLLAAFAAGACSTNSMGSSSVALQATLSGAAEVPPKDGAGTGKLEASFDKTSSLLKWKLTYSGLSGEAKAAHFHGPAMAGSNAGVVVPFADPASPSAGQATLTAPQAADLLDGKWYVNVHTAANPGGEIRGQVLTVK